MGIDWNPNDPGRLGVEHIDAGYNHRPIDSPRAIRALRFRALRTGTVDDLEVYEGSGGGAPVLGDQFNGLERPMLCDIVPAGSEAYTVSSTLYAITAVTGIGAVINEDWSTPITISRLTTSGDGLFVAAAEKNAGFHAQFNTGAFPLDRHVLGVAVGTQINLSSRLRRLDSISAAVTDSAWYYEIPMFSNEAPTVETLIGETIVNLTDAAWRHWTPQMVRDFASGGTRAMRLTCIAGPGRWRCGRIYLKVYWTTERRTGVGIATPNEPGSWTRFDLTTPNATGSPALVAGNDYTLLLRRITDYSVQTVAPFTVLPWRHLRGQDPAGRWRGWTVGTVSSSAIPISTPGITGLVSEIDGIPMARFLSGGNVIDDAQPYELQRGALVYGTQTLTQTITVTGAATSVVYGQATVFAGWPGNQLRPNAPLRVEVVRVSDGIRVFSPVEIVADDVARLPLTSPWSPQDDQQTTYKVVRFRFPESTVLSAGQYRILVQSPDTIETRAWRIGALIAQDVALDQTFKYGSTDRAEGVFLSGTTKLQLQNPGTRIADAQVNLVEVPAAVSGVGTAVGSLTVHHVEICDGVGCGGCADDTLPFTALTWSPAPTGAIAVEAYEVDRLDALAPDWERVADVEGRTTARWEDHEVRIGVQSSYRVRVRRTDGVTGDWSSTVTVTIPKGQVALALSSNAATGMGCVFPEVWDAREVDRTFQFLEAADNRFASMYGRNRQVAFRPLERRGTRFARTVLLNALCSVAEPTMQIFDPLRDLAWAPVPYVCVRDGEGNRWFANVQVPDGSNVRPGERWFADIIVTEVADGPSVHDTSVAQVEGVPDL